MTTDPFSWPRARMAMHRTIGSSPVILSPSVESAKAGSVHGPARIIPGKDGPLRAATRRGGRRTLFTLAPDGMVKTSETVSTQIAVRPDKTAMHATSFFGYEEPLLLLFGDQNRDSEDPRRVLKERQMPCYSPLLHGY